MILKSTFQHIRGISAKKEHELWRAGVVSWDAFDRTQNKQIALFKDPPENSIFSLSRKAFETGDVQFFANCLNRQEHYRIALSFPEKVMFLDIETTGLSKYYDTITLIGWSIGKEYNVLIQGRDDTAFRNAISQAKIIVTFNGSLFDLPFIKRYYPDIDLPVCHVDLRFLGKRAGLSGGQKEIEKKIGIKRDKSLQNMEGEAAPVLWYMYCWGDQSALKKLIAYNHADIEGMKIIFDNAVHRLLKKHLSYFSKRAIIKFKKNKSKIKWTNSASANSEGVQIHPYNGNPGPLVLLKDLEVLSSNPELRIVGIDLTGSEARPSGWCLLRNETAETKCLSRDADIIGETLQSRPHLVSIDSPLSIPEGRISVHDDDPGRDQYGIMRYCERVLKKRGINVYPSLIPSMQKLTARGMRLASQFRSLGIPVIESYPGAAQDIMGIPRKRASLEYLSRGLDLFGIKGNYINQEVSHDELDAITSAVVGLFFWSGKFEALGNDAEEYSAFQGQHFRAFQGRAFQHFRDVVTEMDLRK